MMEYSDIENIEFQNVSPYNYSEGEILSSDTKDLTERIGLCKTDSQTDMDNTKETIQEVEKDQKKDWSCSVCGKGFRYPYTLLRHMPIHTKERKYKCDKCPKAFRQMSTLSQHKATHSSEKPYTCDACGKAFNRGSTLISHRRTHQELKRFACSICHKAFHQKGNLVNHIYTHTNERPYRCEICSRGFNQKSNLVCHMYTLHGKKKSYSCDFCPSSFSRENAYRSHVNCCHRLGAMPVVENDSLTSPPANLFLVTDNILENQENISSNVTALKPLMLDKGKLKNFLPSTLNKSIFSSELNRLNLRVNVLKTPKKPALKIPALPIYTDLNDKIISSITTKLENESEKSFNYVEMQLTDGVVADIIITDMGRNMVVREKPPLVLEEARSKGQMPFLLVIEPGQSPKLCKASLGTEGFIVSPVTNIDLDRLTSSSNQFKIPIVMTIKRIFVRNEELKTIIYIHKQPIQLSTLQSQSGNMKCEIENDVWRDKRKTIVLNEEVTDTGPLCIKVESSRPNSTTNGFLTFKSHIIDTRNKDQEMCRQFKITTFEKFSESENIIRLHLSQLGKNEDQKKPEAEMDQRDQNEVGFDNNVCFYEVKKAC